MPRYFFEIVNEGDVQEDIEGFDVAPDDDLQALVVRRATEALSAEAQDRPPEWWLMTVKDEQQGIVGRVSFVASGFASRR